MYAQPISRIPTKINKQAYIKYVVDIGIVFDHQYDTILTAISLGITYINTLKIRQHNISANNLKCSSNHVNHSNCSLYDSKPLDHTVSTSSNCSLYDSNILDHTTSLNQKSYSEEQHNYYSEEQYNYYSEELAHVVTVLSSKAYEDYGYGSIGEVVETLENKYVCYLEKDILITLNYELNNKFIVTHILIIGYPLLSSWMNNDVVHCMFRYLSSNLKLFNNLKMPYHTFIIAMFLLKRRRKLNFYTESRKNMFLKYITNIEIKYMIPFQIVCSAFIDIYKK